MKIYLNQVSAIGGGATYSVIAVLSYFLATYLGSGLGWGFYNITFVFSPFAMLIASLIHPIGVVYIPITVYLIFRFIEGQSSLVYLFIGTFALNYVVAYVIQHNIDSKTIWMILVMLALLLIELKLRITAIKKRKESGK